MPIVAAAIVTIALVALVAKYAPAYKQGSARDEQMKQCAQIQAALTAASSQGGDPTAQAGLRAQLEECVARANALGAGIDTAGVVLAEADASYGQQIQEWSNYRSTIGEDAVKRNNTRSTILRIAQDSAGTYQHAITLATSAETLSLICCSVLRSLCESADRMACFYDNGAGCGRYGVNEPSFEERAADEVNRVQGPLLAAYVACVDKANGVPVRLTLGMAPYGQHTITEFKLKVMAVYTTRADIDWQDYRRTDYSDAVKRNNLRGDVVRVLAPLAYEAASDAFAAATATNDIVQVRAVRDAVEAQVNASARRMYNVNHGDGSSDEGFGRFGVNEDDSGPKYDQEKAAWYDRFDGLLRAIDAQIATMLASPSYRVTINAARSAKPSAPVIAHITLR